MTKRYAANTIVMPNDKTVGALILPAIAEAYERGTMPTDRLLPAYDLEVVRR